MAKENKKEKVNFGKIFTDGIIKNNPVLVQMVGMCSVLAISSTLTNAVGMGVSVTFVLVMSNLVISLLRNFISDEIRIPSFIVVIAGFVTIVQMLIKAYAPALDQSFGYLYTTNSSKLYHPCSCRRICITKWPNRINSRWYQPRYRLYYSYINTCLLQRITRSRHTFWNRNHTRRIHYRIYASTSIIIYST